MRRMLFKCASALMVMLCLVSCRPDIRPYETGGEKRTWGEVFEQWWYGMNQNYFFFDVDYTGDAWQDVYDHYKPRFDSYGLVDEFDGESGRDALGDFYSIVKNYSDGHLDLYFSDEEGNVITYLMPSVIRLLKSYGLSDEDALFVLYHPDGSSDYGIEGYDGFKNSDYRNEKTISILYSTFGIQDWNGENGLSIHYGPATKGRTPVYFESFGAVVTPEDDPVDGVFTMMLGKTHDGILYFAFSSFELSPFLDDESASGFADDVRALFNAYLAELESGDVSGLVLDYRGNGGGYISDIYNTLSPLADADTTYARIRTKRSDNPGTYNVWHDVVLPAGRAVGDAVDFPVVAITNSYSASSSEFSIMALRAMRECSGLDFLQVGGRTVGATGMILDENGLFNAGTFDVEDIVSNTGMRYTMTTYMPFSQVRYMDGTSYEGVGIAPDIEVPFDNGLFTWGTDGRLDAAFAAVRRM